MYEIALMLHDDDTIDILASNGKQHYILDVINKDEAGEFYDLCRDMLGDDCAVYRTHFEFKSWQSAKKHYDLVVRKGFRFGFQKQYF